LEILDILEHPFTEVLPLFPNAVHQHLLRFC
jgi:hypothetical protein